MALTDELAKITQTPEGWEYRASDILPVWRLIRLASGGMLIVPPSKDVSFVIDTTVDSAVEAYYLLVGYRHGHINGQKEAMHTLGAELKELAEEYLL